MAQGTLFCDYGTDLNSGMSVTGDPAGARGKPGSGFGYGEHHTFSSLACITLQLLHATCAAVACTTQAAEPLNRLGDTGPDVQAPTSPLASRRGSEG